MSDIYASRPDTMHEDEKLLISRAIQKGYSLEIYDLQIDIDDIARNIRMVPKATKSAPSPTDNIPELDTDGLIQRFAKDFGIDYKTYKYHFNSQIVAYKCVDASPSEVTHWTISVPAFIIKQHFSLIRSETAKARMDEVAREIAAHHVNGAVPLRLTNRLKELQATLRSETPQEEA